MAILNNLIVNGISQLNTVNGTWLGDIINKQFLDLQIVKDSMPLVLSTQPDGTNTGAWKGSLEGTGITELYDGLTIKYFLRLLAYGNASLQLTLDDGTTQTDDIPIYLNGLSRLATHYTRGLIIMTYLSDVTTYSGSTASLLGPCWYCHSNYDSTDKTTLTLSYPYIEIEGEAGTLTLVMQRPDGRFKSIVETSSSTGNSTLSSDEFVFPPAMYINSGTPTLSGQVTTSVLIRNLDNVSLIYNTSAGLFTKFSTLYLEGSVNANGYFVVNRGIVSEDKIQNGYIYLLIGRTYGSTAATTKGNLLVEHPIYICIDGKLKDFNNKYLGEIDTLPELFLPGFTVKHDGELKVSTYIDPENILDLNNAATTTTNGEWHELLNDLVLLPGETLYYGMDKDSSITANAFGDLTLYDKNSSNAVRLIIQVGAYKVYKYTNNSQSAVTLRLKYGGRYDYSIYWEVEAAKKFVWESIVTANKDDLLGDIQTALNAILGV